MIFFRLLEDLLVAYILYKVIFDFIIPVARTTKQMKGKMNEMHERMQQQQRAQSEQKGPTASPPTPQAKASADDYIDYEEIKN